jgi:hypothetical protein
VNRRLRVPSPTRRAEEKLRQLRQTVEVRLANSADGDAWVQIERHVELLRAGEDRLERRVVEEAISRCPVE